ncbi:hypothetical protein MNBD_ALPHA04-2433 [hydrothermal vent metagenome]|uniref:Uncharacterized protein n=1 Tax=hydrothermal vent metagenome TaxID=652676 RepID=A0A3B0RUZ9_9ZZZZ
MTEIDSRMRDAASDRVDDESAYWFARMHADNVRGSDQRRFEKWQGQSPEHARAYALHDHVWASMQDASIDEEIMAMRREALSPARPSGHMSWYKYGAIAATLLVFAVSALILNPFSAIPVESGPSAGLGSDNQVASVETNMPQPLPTVFRTAVGERSTIDLPDGSSIELNTDSLIQTNFTAQGRNLVLIRGEALFNVAKDPDRPFVVEADGKRITAIGTTFSVRLVDKEVRVTLIEGIVDVDRVDQAGAILASKDQQRLIAGQQLVALNALPFQVIGINPVMATSWRQGRLVFDNEPLDSVVHEINRYLTQKIVIGDPDLEGLRVSGIFRVGSVSSFATALETSFPVEAQTRDSAGQVVLHWKK